MGRWDRERQALVRTAKAMSEKGLVVGRAGNVSLRLEPWEGRELILVTPSRRSYDDMRPEDGVVMDFEGEPVEGELTPSTESMLHIAIYRARPDIKAVLHTHSPYATAMAVAGRAIPPLVDELVVYVGGAVQVAEYGFPGSEELAAHVAVALGPRNAVLLRNHGVVGGGASLEEALEVCLLVERAAQVYILASAIGKPLLLPREAVEAEEAIFRMAHGETE